jgi:hypothetical protein
MSNTEGREYRIAYPLTDGEWDVVDTFLASDDTAANRYAETHYIGYEWFVLDDQGRNINGGRDQA